MGTAGKLILKRSARQGLTPPAAATLVPRQVRGQQWLGSWSAAPKGRGTRSKCVREASRVLSRLGKARWECAVWRHRATPRAHKVTQGTPSRHPGTHCTTQPYAVTLSLSLTHSHLFSPSLSLTPHTRSHSLTLTLLPIHTVFCFSLFFFFFSLSLSLLLKPPWSCVMQHSTRTLKAGHRLAVARRGCPAQLRGSKGQSFGSHFTQRPHWDGSHVGGACSCRAPGSWSRDPSCRNVGKQCPQRTSGCCVAQTTELFQRYIFSKLGTLPLVSGSVRAWRPTNVGCSILGSRRGGSVGLSTGRVPVRLPEHRPDCGGRRSAGGEPHLHSSGVLSSASLRGTATSQLWTVPCRLRVASTHSAGHTGTCRSPLAPSTAGVLVPCFGTGRNSLGVSARAWATGICSGCVNYVTCGMHHLRCNGMSCDAAFLASWIFPALGSSPLSSLLALPFARLFALLFALLCAGPLALRLALPVSVSSMCSSLCSSPPSPLFISLSLFLSSVLLRFGSFSPSLFCTSVFFSLFSPSFLGRLSFPFFFFGAHHMFARVYRSSFVWNLGSALSWLPSAAVDGQDLRGSALKISGTKTSLVSC